MVPDFMQLSCWSASSPALTIKEALCPCSVSQALALAVSGRLWYAHTVGPDVTAHAS